MKKLLIIVAAMAALATAQDSERKMFGVGAYVPGLTFFGGGSAVGVLKDIPVVLLHVRPVPNIKASLQLGYSSLNREETSTNSVDKNTDGVLLAGLQANFILSEGPMDMSFGLRYLYASETDESTSTPIPAATATETKDNPSYQLISFVFGGEYFLTSYFSMGVEAGLNYATSSQDADATNNINKNSASNVSLDPKITFNAYFM